MFNIIITFIIGFLLGEATGFLRKLYIMHKIMAAEIKEPRLEYLR